jgi:predicted small lipoprotein YifL
MKKIFYLLLCLITLISLAACSGQKNVKKSDGEKTVEAPKEEKTMEEEKVVKEEPATEESSHSEETIPKETKVYKNEVFKDVVVSESAGQFVVTGKAQVFEGVFQYKLHDGDKVLLEDRYQTAGAPAWGDFKISFEKSLVSSNHVLLELFVYSAKDSSKINVLEIPIQP